ncbi:hypothetical protein DJ82_10325 [Halorubrum sp. Ib24]|uniref:DUF7287 family protein n=1 Tax=Halorubrum sp. Ib24 TaxID=1383850 RepID=UPI000B992D3F|nr:hypothetical protein [Halorubrum sp. Ib24]OYR38834.1 hypothetical protein DJ82_10325 [Halorubrum sp. Ib24]
MSGESRTGGFASGGAGRAQTPIDFAVGASVFLLTLGFVIAFVPTVFDPFAGAETASPVVSDRVAAGLVGDFLAASPAEPAVLSPACTAAFFDGDGGNATLAAAAGCPAGVANDTAAEFGLDDDVLVVVHAMGEADPVGNASTVTVDTRYGTHTVDMRRSTRDPVRVDRGGVSVSQRLVSIEGTQYRLTVWVW